MTSAIQILRVDKHDPDTRPERCNINAGAIPAELKELPQWVAWKWRWDKGRRKWDKPPVNASTGWGAKTNDPSTWSSFEKAISVCDQNHSLAGVGFVFTADDPFFGIDIDNCISADGELSQLAQDIIATFPETYCEISPSGIGLKLLLRGSLPQGLLKQKRNGKLVGVEIYELGRYFTVTGQRWGDAPSTLPDYSDAFLRWYPAAFNSDEPEPVSKVPIDRVDELPTVEQVIAKCKAASNGEKFKSLMAGDLTRYNGDHSAADQALCNMLAFWCCENADLMDQCFRESQLYREKWEREDYRDRTIQKAIRDCLKFYDWNPVSRSYDLQDRNDIGNAVYFAKLHAGRLRHVHAWKKWLVWDGCRWKVDDDGAPTRLATETVQKMFAEGLESGDGKIRKFASKTAHAPRLQAMVNLAASQLPVSVEDLDSNGWLLNCPNGTLDLRTGKLDPHQRWQNITWLCPTEYDPKARAPQWSRFLMSVFDNDESLIEFLQRLLGYCLTADVSEQKLAILFGAGANGKSTMLNAFLDVVGSDYAMQAMPDFLMQKQGEAHPTGQASLFGKRFVACVETESSRKLAESTVKLLTGGERIRARRMREDFWEFEPTHKLILCTNHKPVVTGTDHGIWRRLLLVPFAKRFEGRAIDRRLPEKLKVEAPGILAWLVRGCMEWQDKGLQPPPVVTQATQAYRSQEDVIGQFVSDACELAKTSTSRFKDLYSALSRWCEDSGEAVPSTRKFGAWLSGQGHESFSSNGRCYRGIDLKSITEPTERILQNSG